MARFEVPEGWCVQAFRFTLDPTEEQARSLARHFGARRKAYNWTVGILKADIDAWHSTGVETEKPSLRVLRKRWNTVKDEVCVNAETGQPWWRECSKEAYADGIDGAVHGYWTWQTSRAGTRAGKRVGFPRFKKIGPRRRSAPTRTPGASNASSVPGGRGCSRSRFAATVIAWMRVSGYLSNAPQCGVT
ncbi:MAG: putative transposase [Mycobacterium sp.]|nr:putative transposase [Mycobacterium sp.]